MDEKFNGQVNKTMNEIEGIVLQTFEAAHTINPLADADALQFYDMRDKDGRVFEASMVKAAEATGFKFVESGTDPDFKPLDPKVYTKYFNRWDEKIFKTTTRRDEIRKVVKGTGDVTRDSIAADIVASLKAGDNIYDFNARRDLILNAPLFDYAKINGGRVPKNIKGVLVLAREMYNHVKANNSDLTDPAQDTATPADRIRVAITEKLLNLIGVTELANTFHLSEAELFGKLVTINVDDLPAAQQYQIAVYDKNALFIAEWLHEYTNDILANNRYINHQLTVTREYEYNSLFKACKLDCSIAAAAAEMDLYQEQTTHAINPTLNGVATLSNPADTVGENMPYYAKVTPVGALSLNDLNVSVNMGGNITPTAYNAEYGEIKINAVTAPVSITITQG